MNNNLNSRLIIYPYTKRELTVVKMFKYFNLIQTNFFTIKINSNSYIKVNPRRLVLNSTNFMISFNLIKTFCRPKSIFPNDNKSFKFQKLVLKKFNSLTDIHLDCTDYTILQYVKRLKKLRNFEILTIFQTDLTLDFCKKFAIMINRLSELNNLTLWLGKRLLNENYSIHPMEYLTYTISKLKPLTKLIFQTTGNYEQQCITLRHLSNSDISDISFKFSEAIESVVVDKENLVSLFPKLKNLTLDLRNTHVDVFLNHNFQAMINLKTLNVRFGQDYPETLPKILDLITFCSYKVENLDISCELFSIYAANTTLNEISRFNKLKRFRFGGSIYSMDLIELAKIIESNHELEDFSLRLYYSSYDEDSLGIFLRSLERARLMKRFEILNDSLRIDTIRGTILEKSISSMKELEYLNIILDFNNIAAKKVIDIFSQFKLLVNLQELNLTIKLVFLVINDESLPLLGQSLSELPKLQDLTITFNFLKKTTKETLTGFLNMNYLTDRGFGYFFAQIKSIKNLKRLEFCLAHCKYITDEGLKVVISNFKFFHKLKLFKLAITLCQQITEKSIYEILAQLRWQTSLSSCSLHFNLSKINSAYEQLIEERVKNLNQHLPFLLNPIDFKSQYNNP